MTGHIGVLTGSCWYAGCGRSACEAAVQNQVCQPSQDPKQTAVPGVVWHAVSEITGCPNMTLTPAYKICFSARSIDPLGNGRKTMPLKCRLIYFGMGRFAFKTCTVKHALQSMHRKACTAKHALQSMHCKARPHPQSVHCEA